MNKEYEFLIEFGELLKKYDVEVNSVVEYDKWGCVDSAIEFRFNNSPYKIVRYDWKYIDHKDMFELAGEYKEGRNDTGDM